MTSPGPAGSPPYPVPPGPATGTAPFAAAGVPAPPTGPGVAPPFPAPPTEGRTARVWIGLGVAGLAVALCCGGGATALVGLVVTGSEAVNEQAHVVVGDYLNAVKNHEYDKAYGLLCDAVQGRESPRQFAQRVAAGPQITSYHIGQLGLTGDLTVPVEVTYEGGAQDTRRVALAQDTGTGRLEVCGGI